jgi:hypothetical protein
VKIAQPLVEEKLPNEQYKRRAGRQEEDDLLEEGLTCLERW